MAAYVHILRFPDDILQEILESLEGESLLTCRVTCRRLDTLISDSVRLQYKIELLACGMVDGSQTLDAAEKLKRLRLYDAAWRSLEWTGHTTLPHLEDRWFPPSMAAAGALVFHSADTFPNDPRSLLQQVSSKLRGIPEQHLMFPVAVGHNALLDNAQDLLVFAPKLSPQSGLCRCHLRTLSTGEAHPLGTLLDPCSVMGSRNLIEICGDHILEAVCTYRDFFYYQIVWNWKTGRIELTLSDDPSHRSVLQYTRFLDSTHIFIVEAKFDSPACIQVYAFGHAPLELGGAAHDVAATPSHSFLLPELSPRAPGMVQPSLAHGCSHSSADASCFHSDFAERLLSLRLSWPGTGLEDPTFIFIDIPLKTLRSYIAAHPTRASHAIPWGEWGQRTRVARGYARLGDWEPFTYGMRRIEVQRSDNGEGLMLHVLDYHAGRVGRALARQRHGAEGAEDVEVIVSPSDASADGMVDGLRTTLPCLVKHLSVPPEVSRRMTNANTQAFNAYLCEDGLIFVEQDASGGFVTRAWEYTF
ncbi:hypothetical protein BV25DRAFT_1902777 [Artomyces pyxidatus]|uniref:Uncharacterized protein n=1 Tax=Artomyces pyxidatus TaxID=48021 RepID=A0ACB8SLB6_9AGAM|nr:hypothetical protein BV25DRAFT_1902777 [Artomyces pyxidatus]